MSQNLTFKEKMDHETQKTTDWSGVDACRGGLIDSVWEVSIRC